MSFGFTNNNNSTGFGSSNTGGGGFGGFGSNNNNNASTGASLFGGNTATSGGGGFGGFGSANNTNNAFGAKSTGGFGATATTSGGGLFGSNNNSNTSTTGGFGTGGFGNNNTASAGFGSTNSGGGKSNPGPDRTLQTVTNSSKGLFGANKTTGGFGASNTGNSLFGSGSSNTMGGGFGGTASTSNAFGASAPNNNPTSGFGASSTGGGFGTGGAFGASTSVPMSNQGSAAVPFQAFSEKDGASSSTSAYQSLAFQEPYKNQSFEELRTQDYVQGRRFGNTNGQAGSFGTSTGFGGFGAANNTTNTGGGLFGATTNNNNNTAASGASGFGGFGNNNAANNNGSGFGAGNTGGGLFGAKPGGGLFGSGGTSSASTTGGFGATSGTGGGLFGSSNNNTNTNTTGGFGSTNNTTGGGLFGNPTTNTSGFNANNNTTGGGLFGATDQSKPATTNLFGGSNNTNAGGGGLFGNNNSNTGAGFGASNNAGGGLFGANNNANNNQAKPAFGGFGGTSNTNSGGGLFGNTNNNANTNTNTGNSLFGNTANNSSGGGLFGNANNQNKPAGGLFGSSNTTTNTGGGLFGNSASTGGNLFGNTTNNANNANSSSLFGNMNQSQNRPAGGSLFGNNSNNNTGGLSLFGNSNSNQNQNNSGNSLFGSQNNQNGNSLFGNSQGQQGNQMHAALTSSAYGNDQLFTSVGSSAQPLGPLATPLANARAAPKKTQSLLASVRMSSPVYTPRGSSIGRKNTYGFSYSAYGSPGSAYSMSLTPGANTMLKASGSLSSGLGNRLTKSMSTNDLRDGSSAQGSLLRPSMLNPGGGRAYGSGSMRKLNIDRTLREDFFGTPKQSETPKPAEEREPERRVVFDSSADKREESTAKPSAANALVRVEVEESEEASPQTNGVKRSEMEQVKESSNSSTSVTSTTHRLQSSDPKNSEPGAYYTKPSTDQLKRMSRQQLQKMGGLIVGRENIGKIEFGPCDLSSVPLDQICGELVQLETRAATVYPDISKKPEVGRGLNVPATISLEKSWPRKSAMKHKVGDTSSEGYRNHVNHLKRIGDTKFVDYDSSTGVWRFSVDHFTTYGLDDDDEELPHEMDTSGLSDAPETSPQEGEITVESIEVGVGDVDDTFEFKLDQRQMQPPGGYGISFDYDDPSADEEIQDEEMGHEQSYASSEKADEYEEEADLASSGGPVQPVSSSALTLHQASVGSGLDDEFDVDPEMPGSFVEEPKMPRSILKPSLGGNAFASPEKLATEAWEQQLQRTMSPRKRDRQALKEFQADAWKPVEQEDIIQSPFKQSMLGQSLLNQSYLAQKSAKKSKHGASLSRTKKSEAFRTSMDIMNSLWEHDKADKKALDAAKALQV
nr:nucleoporin [Quercus suber]